MVFTEFRIPLPLTVEEFQVAQLYMVVKASKDNTGGGEGVVWLKNEPYDNTDGHMGNAEFSGVEVPKNKGQYTLKHYHLASKIPWAVAKMLPEDAMILIEEAWNAYPHCKTVLTNGYLSRDKFKIVIETMHLPDDGSTENALNLDKKQLKKRKVKNLDIINAGKMQEGDDYKGGSDPTTFVSEKTGRGPLAEGWQKSADPVMCCYKLVTADFIYWGLQGKIEGSIEGQQEKLFTVSLAQAYTLIDEWHGLTMEDIRRLEKESAAELSKELGGEEGESKTDGDAGAGSADAATPAAGSAPAAAAKET